MKESFSETGENGAALEAYPVGRGDDDADAGLHTYTHRFRKPFHYMKKAYGELTFDWDSLTGKDGLDVENEMLALGSALIAPEISYGFQFRIAAKACTEQIGYDAFELMPLRDATKIRRAARSFLLAVE